MKSVDTPLLTICIPIYNRLEYLDRMLDRFLEDKDLFQEKIYLFISDNCSAQDLESCCLKYKELGLNLDYSRNSSNLGADGNFLKCFKQAKGQYGWLLGSDDIPVKGFLSKLVEFLSHNDCGLVYLDMEPNCSEIKHYTDKAVFFSTINLGITFMSSNIFCTQSVGHIELEPFHSTYLIQVPQYIEAGCMKDDNVIVKWGQIFEKDTDAANNGGYNFYQVFVENLFSIYQVFIDNRKFGKNVLNAVKKAEFRAFILPYSEHILRNLKTTKFKYQNGFKITFKHYGFHLYAYCDLFLYVKKRICEAVARKFKKN